MRNLESRTDYQKTLKILAELEKGDLEDGLQSCFAFTKTKQVIYFDDTGAPFTVGIEGAALVKKKAVQLPSQPMQVVSTGEAYNQLVAERQGNSLEQQLGRVVNAVLSGQNKRKPGKLHWWIVPLILLSLVVLWQAFGLLFNKPQTSFNSSETVVKDSKIYKPIGNATISKATFKQFLSEMNSPALPEAEAMYDACVSEGCDPALAAAFFEHESSGGNRGVAVVTKSIGNIRCSEGYTCYTTQGNGSFRQYPSWTDGLRDWAQLLKTYRFQWKLATLEEIVPVYAPAADHNDEQGYIAAVKKRVDDLRSRKS